MHGDGLIFLGWIFTAAIGGIQSRIVKSGSGRIA